MKIPEIIFFTPNRVWRTYTGGRVLDQLEGKTSPKDSHFPEDWIASTTQATNKGREEIMEGLSEILLNDQKLSLVSLFRKYPIELLGKSHFEKYGANTQFLLKFLDSAEKLHIQAHPTVQFAQQYLNSNSGKTEAYIILGTREEVKDPYIYLGFQKTPEKELFKKAIEEQDNDKLLSYFEKIPVRQGSVFIVPGGLPHAIGEGVFMIEIMEPTDFVVRLEFKSGDYELPEDARFMGRDIDFAMNMIDFSLLPAEEVRKKYFCTPRLFQQQKGGKEEVLIGMDNTNCFSVHRVSVKETFFKSARSFYIGIVTKGNGTVYTKNEQLIVKQGDKFFIPYYQEEVIFSSKNAMEIILTFPPE